MHIDEITKELQNLDQAADAVMRFHGGHADRMPWEHVKLFISALITGIPYLGYTVDKPIELLRGRIKNDTNALTYAKDFSYCPTDKSVEFGRCHKPHSTIFYGARNLETVFSELSPDVDDIVHIGYSKLKEGHSLKIATIGDIDHMRRFNKTLIGDDSASEELKSALKLLSDDMLMRARLIDAFIAEQFYQPVKNKKGYKVTSAFAEILLYELGEDKLDGFAYPSVAHRGGINYVIKPDSFDHHFEWVNFLTTKITGDLQYGIYTGDTLTESNTINNDGTILW